LFFSALGLFIFNRSTFSPQKEYQRDRSSPFIYLLNFFERASERDEQRKQAKMDRSKRSIVSANLCNGKSKIAPNNEKWHQKGIIKSHTSLSHCVSAANLACATRCHKEFICQRQE
jgi:hypothetical protein